MPREEMKMLRSLEKLRKGYFSEYPSYESTHPQFQHDRAEKLAGEIQEEIDRCYLPRPLFEDGEPVQFGDLIQGSSHCKFDNRVRFDRIIYYDTGRVRLDVAGGDGCMLQIGQRLERPPEPDTQEKIDADLLLTARDYCNKYGLSYAYPNESSFIVIRRDLLARQRKLDGVE